MSDRGRDRTLIRNFQREIERQCRFAMLSLQDIEQSREEGDGLFFWYSVESLLVAVGRITRILWPEEESRFPEMRRELRDTLGLSDESPFLPLGIVEKFENFDRVLEDWYATSESRRFFDLYTEPLDVLADTTTSDRFRGYDTEKDSILFNGVSYPTAPVSRIVEDLAARAARELAKPRFDTE
ncbi:hypothetical protein [Rubrobacter indicoceani]|uniref:hypothetical protein n=1 Tax=Rubrobacter indicoceani TaxID=2051957 RepID=UPI000E5C5052|nr:hypothetical protein [Rubrobacter indicoceani]